MEWYDYLMAFFGGAFLANFVPHYVRGVTGHEFPTPFAKPPGKGMSSPMTNVWWAVFNLIVGSALLWFANVSRGNPPALLTALIGFIVMSPVLAMSFGPVFKKN